MKKIIALVCMITCLFGLTACGSEESYTEYEQQKIAYAEELAKNAIIPFFQNFMDDANVDYFAENTAEEIEYILSESYGLEVEGYATITAISSYNLAADSIGAIVEIGEATSYIDDKSIVVNVDIVGEKKNATAEVIFSNDLFMVMESAALNEESSMGELMKKAALNTVIGMGTVFLVLILISFIISLFGFIPKIQGAFANRKNKKDAKSESIDNTIAQIVEKEESVEVSDDLELIAVIAAAIAASEGQTSTDGFVVRSIRKVSRK